MRGRRASGSGFRVRGGGAAVWLLPAGRFGGVPALAFLLFCWVAGGVPAAADDFAGRARDPEALLFQGVPAGAKDAGAWDFAGSRDSAAGFVYTLVQGTETVTEEWLEELVQAGLEPVRYVPNNAYIFRTMDGAKAAAQLPVDEVRRFFILGPDNRVAPETGEAAAKAADDALLAVAVTLWPEEDAGRAVQSIEDNGGEVTGRADVAGQPFLTAEVPAAAVQELAALPEIEWIEPVSTITLRNDLTGAMVESGTPEMRPFRNSGLFGAGQVVGHIDSTLNALGCFFADPAGIPPGPDHRKLLRTAGATNPTTHGSHTAATIAGWRMNGDLDKAGIAPAARLSHANYRELIPHADLDVPQNFNSLYGLLNLARGDGAAIHSNSWGDDERTNYTYLAAAADLFVFLHEETLVVFAASNEATLRTPENARNVLAVGASRRYPDKDVKLSGGVGPTFDGRMKPDLYAPGHLVESAFSGMCSTGGLSGTSMATAAVSGAAALVREYFQTGRYPTGDPGGGAAFTPSGALLKAVLLNAAQDLVAEEDYPSQAQGWGRVQLDRALPTGPEGSRRLYVEDHRASFGHGMRTGQSRSVPVLVKRRDEPLRVTLTWDDPPVSRAAESTVVNDLDLQVIGPDGVFYRGNVFENRRSVTGSTHDPLNNVEQIHLPAPQTGLYQIVVDGAFVEPRNAPQGFALAASGGIYSPASGPVLLFAPGDVPANRSAQLYLLHPGIDTSTVTVEVTGESGDVETFTLFQRFAGIYESPVSLAIGEPVPGNGLLDGRSGETFTARFQPGPEAEPVEATITLRAAGTDGPTWRMY